jgi:hypothetical protein
MVLLMMSKAIYLASTDVPAVQVRAKRGGQVDGDEPVNLNVKLILVGPLAVTLKTARQYPMSLRRYQTDSCHVPLYACFGSGWAKQPVQLLPTSHPGE